MKIVHVIIACFYKEGFGYQENILPAKHKELGYDVSIIAHRYGNYEASDYLNDNGVNVHILANNSSKLKKVPVIKSVLRITSGLEERLEIESPDIIFVHGLQALDNLAVCEYAKRHPLVKVFADQHGDYYNMPMRSLKEKFMQKVIYKYVANELYDVSEMIWGVTPWRVKFIRDVYKLPETKTNLLVMGGDEKKVDWENREHIRIETRKKYGIPVNAFVVVTGGKIDRAKNIHMLVEAIKRIPDVYLLIFGRYESDMEEYPDTIDCERIINVGWIASDYSYALFHASDLAVFPGTHSVLWEQACASGIPAIFKDWDGGFLHVDVGGNCKIIKNPSSEVLYNVINEILDEPTLYDEMKENAQNIARTIFSYCNIAKKSIKSNESNNKC